MAGNEAGAAIDKTETTGGLGCLSNPADVRARGPVGGCIKPVRLPLAACQTRFPALVDDF